MRTTRASRLLERLAVGVLTALYFAAVAIDSMRRSRLSRTHVNTERETLR